MVVQPHTRPFTVDEYYRMAEAGIIGRDERVELIKGRIVELEPIGVSHSWCVSRLIHIFAALSGMAVQSIRNPLRLDDRSEPEPDVVLLRLDTPQDRHPRPEHVLLVVEVADTSLAYDRGTKAPLYARHGIPELWITDLGGERLEIHRDPSPDGYRLVQVFGRGQQITPAFAPDLVIEVNAMLGEAGRELR